MEKTLNKPYVKQFDENGNVSNPIDKHNPYFTIGPSRQARRFVEHGKVYQLVDHQGQATGITFRRNGSNSKPSSYRPSLNSTIKSLLKSLGNNKYLKRFLRKQTSEKLKLA